MTRNLYRLIAAIGVSLGGLAALMFSIPNFSRMNSIYDSMSSRVIVYAVLLLLIVAGAITMNILLYTKLKDKVQQYGLFFAILPIWAIEAFSLITVNYEYLGQDGTAMFTFILTLSIIAVGSVGFNLMRRGKRIAGRICTSIFLAIVLVGTIMGFVPSNGVSDNMVILGNVLRLFAIAAIGIVLYGKVNDGDAEAVTNEHTVPTIESARPTKKKEEPAATAAIEARQPEEPKQSLREKLVEAKALYEDGLISEEEYAEIKKQAIQNK